MARKNAETTEATTEETTLLAIADLIYAAFGNSSTAAPTAPVKDETPAPVVESADEVDADEDVDIEQERETLMKESIASIRKKLVEQGFDAASVKAEKSKAALVDNLLDDLYGDDEEEDEDDEEETEPEDADEAEDDEDDTDADDEDEADDEEDEDEEDDLYTEEELGDYSLAELKEIASEWELDISKGARAKTYVKAILEAQEADEDEEADDEEDGDEEDERAELEALTLPELRKVAKDDYGLTASEVKGQDKDSILALIFEDDEESEEDA